MAKVKLSPNQRNILKALADSQDGLTYEGIRQTTSLEYEEAYPVVSTLRRLDYVEAKMEKRGSVDLPSKYLYCTPTGLGIAEGQDVP